MNLNAKAALNSVTIRGRKILGSVCLSIGVLAIANSETIWQEYHRGDLQESHELINAGINGWRSRAKKPLDIESPTFKPLQSALSRSLEQDELREQNPFAHLSSLDPLQDVMRKGVVKFHRETFRSPTYQDESGYDMISYEVEHTDGSHSTIMAYLESGDPFVVFMVSSGTGSTYSFYRGNALVEQSALTSGEAQAFVAHRLSGGIPFLSVSR